MSAAADGLDPDVAQIVAELSELIRAAYPDATFATRIAPDGRIFLDAFTPAENDFDIHRLVADRAVDFMIGAHPAAPARLTLTRPSAPRTPVTTRASGPL
jgi:hypothetical protein